MITQRICLRKACDWRLTIFYCPTLDDTDEVLDALVDAGCPKDKLRKASNSLCSGEYNTGLTYSNSRTYETVMVIGRVTSFEELVNTFCHEKWHCCVHIIRTFGLNIDTEEAAYLVGDISGEIFNNALRAIQHIAYIDFGENRR